MIITASRISTSSGAGQVSNHVFDGPKNESINPLQGTPQELEDMVRDAEAHSSKYSMRHFKISAQSPMTSEDALTIAGDLGIEFGFDPSSTVIIEHQKKRVGNKGFELHYHVIAPEKDPISGKVLDNHWMRPRHEKIARIAEERLGHKLIAGRWNKAVAKALSESNPELSSRVSDLATLPRPESAYTAGQHQKAQRKGKSQPEDRLAITSAWEQSDGPQAFTAALAEQGITVRAGDKAGIWIAERDGQLIGAVHRLTHETKDTVATRMTAPEPTPPEDNPNLHIEVQPSIMPEGMIATPDATASPPSQDERKSTPAPIASPSGGGGASLPLDGTTAQSLTQPAHAASTAETIEGPGEPPGPNAGPLEIQEYRKRLMAYEDRRAAANRAQSKAASSAGGEKTPANNQSGGSNEPVRQQQKNPNFSAIIQGFRASAQAAAIHKTIVEQPDEPRDDRADSGYNQEIGEHDTQHTREHVGITGEIDGYGSAARGRSNADTGTDRRSNTNIEGIDRTQKIDRGLAAAKLKFALPAADFSDLRKARNTLLENANPVLRMQKALAVDRKRISSILSTHPHPSPVDLDPVARASLYANRISENIRKKNTDAEKAAKIAIHARNGLSATTKILAFVGIPTPASLQYQQLLQHAQRLDRQADEKPTKGEYKQARQDGQRDAHAAQRAVAAWEKQPNVTQALEDQRLNSLALSAARNGDTEIGKILKTGNLNAARSIVRQRETAEQIRLDQKQKQQFKNGQTTGGPKRR